MTSESNKLFSNIFLAIDVTFFSHKEVKSGSLSLSLSLFTHDILKALAALGVARQCTLLVCFNHLEYFRREFSEYRLCAVKWWPVTLLYKLTRGRKNAIKLIKKCGVYSRIIKKLSPTILWLPYYAKETFIKTSLPTLATVHDIYRFHYGKEKEKRLIRYYINRPNLHLVAVSSYTKQDILTNLIGEKEKEGEGKIKVITSPNSFDVEETEEVKEVSTIPYILDLNAYTKKKNTLTLLNAFFLIKDKTPCHLVLCGGYKEEEYFCKIQEYIKDNFLTSRVHVFLNVSKKERNYLLHNAKLFVTPSLYEGMGVTPIEAALCSVPVLSSKESSLFEATMGLCNYVEDAKDPKEYAALILQVLEKYKEGGKEELAIIAKKLRAEYQTSLCATRYIAEFNALYLETLRTKGKEKKEE